MKLPTSVIETRNLIYQAVQAAKEHKIFVKVGKSKTIEHRDVDTVVTDIQSQCEFMNIHGRLPDDLDSRVRWSKVRSHFTGCYVDVYVSFSDSFENKLVLRVYHGCDRPPQWVLHANFSFGSLCDIEKPLHVDPQNLNVVSWIWRTFSGMFEDPKEFANILEQDHQIPDVAKTATLTVKRRNTDIVDEIDAAKEAGMERKRKRAMDLAAIQDA